MLGPKQEAQGALFYEFSIDDHVPQDHLLRSIDRFVDLSCIRPHLAEFYSHTGRPSIDPELLIRMLLVGYCLGIRSERRLVKKCISISPIAGSAASTCPILCLIIRHFPKPDMAGSAIVTCCAIYLKRPLRAALRMVW